MKLYGASILEAFNHVLSSAFLNIDQFNLFVKAAGRKLTLQRVPRNESGEFKDISIADVCSRAAKEIFRQPSEMDKWTESISSMYGTQQGVLEAIQLLTRERDKPAFWSMSDTKSVSGFVFEDTFLNDTIGHVLRSRYREDEFTAVSDRNSERSSDMDRKDYNSAGCIIVALQSVSASPLRHLVENILDFAREDQANQKNGKPLIVFTADSREAALEVQKDIAGKWRDGRPPFLFLTPSDTDADIAAARQAAEAFFGMGPPQQKIADNDLVILVGGCSANPDDSAPFDELKRLLGQIPNNLLVAINPWKADTGQLAWNDDLERKLDAASRPLLIELVDTRYTGASEKGALVDFLARSAISRPIPDFLRLEALRLKASKQRLVWKPTGKRIEVAGGAEFSMQSPSMLASDIKQRLGLSNEDSPFAAYVAVEEVVVGEKLDGKLRKALKKNLSIIVGGDGKPPSTDRVEPFSFRIVPEDPDPLYLATQKFRRSQPNIVAACNLSAGTDLEQYLTDINARIREGVNRRDKSEQLPDFLRIVVMVHEPNRPPDRLDNELTDNSQGIWRIIKLRREKGDYVAYRNDIESAKAWVNEQLSGSSGSA